MIDEHGNYWLRCGELCKHPFETKCDTCTRVTPSLHRLMTKDMVRK
jgi:hypothetical protein